MVWRLGRGPLPTLSQKKHFSSVALFRSATVKIKNSTLNSIQSQLEEWRQCSLFLNHPKNRLTFCSSISTKTLVQTVHYLLLNCCLKPTSKFKETEISKSVYVLAASSKCLQMMITIVYRMTWAWWVTVIRWQLVNHLNFS